MPFKALHNDQPFYAEKLTEENRRDGYVCPICSINFISVIPPSGRVKHFRHDKGGKAHGEPDGPEHRAMKSAVKTRADALGFSTYYEVRIIDDMNKITDVLVEVDYISSQYMNFKGFAVECQCASISVDEYQERNQVYRKNGFVPLWILGEKYFDFFSTSKLVNQIVTDSGFCSFFIKNQFYTEEDQKQSKTTLDDIFLKLSGYYKDQYKLNRVSEHLETIHSLTGERNRLKNVIGSAGFENHNKTVSLLKEIISKKDSEISNQKILIRSLERDKSYTYRRSSSAELANHNKTVSLLKERISKKDSEISKKDSEISNLKIQIRSLGYLKDVISMQKRENMRLEMEIEKFTKS
jgi:competence CoiA-like predicted nuclease